MWLFIPEGFFSIVTAEEFGHPLQVRARCEEDLDRLRKSYLPKLGSNVALLGRDYPWRAFTTREDLAEGLAKIAQGLDYSNFKNEVAVRHSYDRAHVYGEVWSSCRKIETGATRH
jgi:hypothetical protein